jgi:hypothetical protein
MPKGLQILLFTLLGAALGTIIFLSKPTYNVYRFQLEHLEGRENDHSTFWFRDRVEILPNTNFVCRLYSIADVTKFPMVENEMSEVKVYAAQPLELKDVLEPLEQYLGDKPIRVFSHRKQEEIRQWNTILRWLVSGFFVGVAFNFFVSRNGNSQTHKQQ